MQSKLEQLFSTPPSENDRFLSNNLKKTTRNGVFSIHSLATLGELLAEKKKGNEIPDLRYLVDINGKAWFARETHTSAPPAPAHYKMTGSPRNAAYCKTAGNLFFSYDYSTLLKLNNKSGDFRPSFNSLKWILAILVANEDKLPFQLPEVLTIEEQGHNGKVIETHLCSRADIKAWLKTFSENTKLTVSWEKQNAKTQVVHYEREGGSLVADVDKENSAVSRENKVLRKLQFGNDEPVKRKLVFEDIAPSAEPSMSDTFKRPARLMRTYTALKNSSLPLFGPRTMTSPVGQQQTLAPLIFEQETAARQFGEEFGPNTTPPPLKKESLLTSLAR